MYFLWKVCEEIVHTRQYSDQSRPLFRGLSFGLNIQGYVQLVVRGKDDEARAVIAQDLPFAQLICRICDHPCEHACNRCKVAASRATSLPSP